MKYIHQPPAGFAKASTGHGMWSPSSGASAFASDEGQFPYPFFFGLIATIGLCLGLWTMHAKQQQSMAIEDCIETELASEMAGNVERATSICEMKCVRGELASCM